MRYLFIALTMLTLVACSETITLSKPDGGVVASGSLRFNPNPPHRLTVVLDGKTYKGDISSEEVDDSDHLRKRYGANSKHYRRIFLGLDVTHHVHHYQGTLKATDGATLTCHYLSSRSEVLGTCEDDKGQAYEVRR